MLRTVTAVAVLGLLTACGGGGEENAATQAPTQPVTGRYSVGVYYYPGWSKGVTNYYVDGYWCPGGTGNDPWCTIQKYPEREPKLLSWYQDNQPEVLRQQVKLMSENGINFVIFDWYIKRDTTTQPAIIRPSLDQALKAFKLAEKPAGFKFALMWDNVPAHPKTLEEFDTVSDMLIAEFKDPRGSYLKTAEGKPIVIWHSVEHFYSMFEAITALSPQIATPNALVERFRARVAAAGFPGVHLVVGLLPSEHWLYYSKRWGFDAITAYNYHRAYYSVGGVMQHGPLSESYKQLDDIYRNNWTQVLLSPHTVGMNYYVPVTTGWNQKPWQQRGVIDPHDNSWGTDIEFRDHLLAARAQMDKYPTKTGNMTVVCCWNEYGEGSILEPIKGRPNDFLLRVKEVFGS